MQFRTLNPGPDCAQCSIKPLPDAVGFHTACAGLQVLRSDSARGRVNTAVPDDLKPDGRHVGKGMVVNMKTYMFCNAHLDPVWLWRREEGLSETLSTFRSAASLLEEYPELIFNHNESILYEWVEEHDPALFERIRAFVEEGRWKIVGGWYLQPDCNMPSGESIYRQVLTGRIYFYDKFGKVPVTAVNMDPFGHARGLVQMLRKCGFSRYVNIRPGKNDYDFESEDFFWRGYDGVSEVLVHRSDKGYNSVLGGVESELPEWASQREHLDRALYLWGVGNHGGGPSRRDLDSIRKLVSDGMDLVHASPDDYFDSLDTSGLPVVERGLNPVAEGCYTSVIRIKQLHRRLENELVMCEKMASHAALSSAAYYEKEKLDEAWRDLLFAEFHDALPGSCIQPVEEDTIRLLCHGLEITSRLKAKYMIALCSGEAPVRDGDTVPLFVYNPHPFECETVIDAPFTLPVQLWHNLFSEPKVYSEGRLLPCQSAKEDGNFYMDWSKRVLFSAKLAPMSVSRFDIKFELLEKRPAPVSAPDRRGRIKIETARGEVVINSDTGLVDSYKVDGSEYLKPGAMSLELYGDSYNSWGGQPRFARACALARFSPMTPGQATDFSGVKGCTVTPVRVTEEGALAAVVEADMICRDSKAVVRYIVNKKTGALDVRINLFFGEKEKRVRLRVPTSLGDGRYTGQTIFGREELDCHGSEAVSQYWQAVSDGTRALTITDDGIYGSRFSDGVVELTLARSAGYGAAQSAWGEPYKELMYQPRMEQSERRYAFSFMGGASDERLVSIDSEAAVFNQKPYVMSYCPDKNTTSVRARPLVSVDSPNVSLSAFKRSERDPECFILRFYESCGIPTEAVIELPLMNIRRKISFGAFEIKTFSLSKGVLAPTDMLEGAVPLDKGLL